MTGTHQSPGIDWVSVWTRLSGGNPQPAHTTFMDWRVRQDVLGYAAVTNSPRSSVHENSG